MFRIRLKRLMTHIGPIKCASEVKLTTEDGKTRTISGFLSGDHPDGYIIEMAGGGPEKTLQVQHHQTTSCSFEVLMYQEDSALAPELLARLTRLNDTTEEIPK